MRKLIISSGLAIIALTITNIASAGNERGGGKVQVQDLSLKFDDDKTNKIEKDKESEKYIKLDALEDKLIDTQKKVEKNSINNNQTKSSAMLVVA
tara:strand:+ start:2359 stop:2643 length:285 start_codon:yes stop_codon:yes gene_type:complete